ncbi:MAG: hypothetical protein ISR58_03370 [Anaerolineales bacterium]|nr:hypothetical protein [Chloroflexota bacterium]MBL6980212.1 hypothetical protein [Anaerolineales bacterium]
MEKVDLVYFVEHVARELDIACAVKAILEKNTDISVKIASITHGLKDVFDAYQPKVVALPYCVAVHEAGLDKIVARWSGAKFINLAYEQVLGKAQKNLNSPKDDFAREYVMHHAWGDFFAQYLQDNNVPETHIAVNGNPSYALYREPYKEYYGNQRRRLAEQFGLDSEKRWIFVPENYGWAFFRDHMVRARIRRGFDPEHAYQYRDFARKSLQTSAQWWRDAIQVESVELIVRPRPAIPAESFVETVREMAGDALKKVHFIKHGTVREWILASDLVISNFSTTLLEAAVARKPVYMMVPYPFPEFLFAEWYEIVEKIETGNAFNAVIAQNEVPDNWKDLEEWAINQMISRGDAISGLAEILASLVCGQINVPPPVEIAHQLERMTPARVVRLARKHGWNLIQSSLSALGIKTQDQGWTAHESDLVTDEVVEQRVRRWKEILN